MLATSMRRALLVALAVPLAACSSDPAAPADAGTDAPPADAGPALEAFAEIGATTEGIALGRTPEGDSVLYVSTLDDRVVRIAPDGTVSDFVSLNDPLGIAVRADGSLVVCGKRDETEGAAPVLFAVALDGTVSEVLSAGPGDAPLGLTNFVAIAPDGSLVFSDSMADRVFRADADGANVALITDAITYPNGLAFSPDGTTLYVASWDGRAVHALSFDESTGAYGAPEVAIEGVANVDGVVTATGGELYLVTSTRGVLRASPGSEAPPASVVPSAAVSLPANGAFGDAAFGEGTLYLTSLASRSVHRIVTGDTGAPLPAE